MIFEVERGAILAVRTAVNIYNEWMLGLGGQPKRLREIGLYFELVVVAHESERLYFSNLLPR